MSACQQAKRRRRQMVNGYSHIGKRKRPIYRKRSLLGLGESIARERARQAAEAKRKASKK